MELFIKIVNRWKTQKGEITYEKILFVIVKFQNSKHGAPYLSNRPFEVNEDKQSKINKILCFLDVIFYKTQVVGPLIDF